MVKKTRIPHGKKKKRKSKTNLLLGEGYITDRKTEDTRGKSKRLLRETWAIEVYSTQEKELEKNYVADRDRSGRESLRECKRRPGVGGKKETTEGIL